MRSKKRDAREQAHEYCQACGGGLEQECAPRPTKRAALGRAQQILKIVDDFLWFHQRHSFAWHLVSEFTMAIDVIESGIDISLLDDSDVQQVAQAWNAIWSHAGSWERR